MTGPSCLRWTSAINAIDIILFLDKSDDHCACQLHIHKSISQVLHTCALGLYTSIGILYNFIIIS